MSLRNQHPQLHEKFLFEDSKVNDLVNFLEQIVKDDKSLPVKDYSTQVTDTNFCVMQQNIFRQFHTSSKFTKKIRVCANINQTSFMRQIEVSEKVRKMARRDRIIVATSFRRLGNMEYRLFNLNKALEYYTKALCYINDSPVLYLNRSLCNVKKYQFKNALFDVEYVLRHLDSVNLLAWLYKAGCLKRLNDEKGYQDCVTNVRICNPKSLEFIDTFLQRMKGDF